MRDRERVGPVAGNAGFEAGNYTAVIVRLLLNERGGIMNGELATLEGERVCRFLGWNGLTRALRDYLAAEQVRGPRNADGDHRSSQDDHR